MLASESRHHDDKRDLLGDLLRIKSANGKKRDSDANVVHELVEYEEPNGVPHPASGFA